MNIVVKKNQNHKFPYCVEMDTGEQLSSRPFQTKEQAMDFADMFLQGKTPKIASPGYVPPRIIDQTGEAAVKPSSPTFGLKRTPGQETPSGASEGHGLLKTDGGGRVLEDTTTPKAESENLPLTKEELTSLKQLLKDLQDLESEAEGSTDQAKLKEAAERLDDIQAAVGEIKHQAGVDPKFLSHDE